MHASILFLTAVATSVFAQAGTECLTQCNTAYDNCRSQPDANRATCASEYASCLGYVPFDNNGSLVTPTACAAATAPTGTAPCVSLCNTAYDNCRSQPNANRATCASEYAGCLGYVPFDSNGSLVTPTACSATASATPAPTGTAPCVSACNSAYDTCRSQPNANRATCASEYSTCLGYVPFDSNGSLVAPTACSAAPIATAPPAPTGSACLAKCDAEYSACRTVPIGAPSANQAACAAQYANCLGYSPFNAGPNGTYVTPTACSAGAAATGTGATKPTGASPTPSPPQFTGAASRSSMNIVGVVGAGIAAVFMI